MIVKCLDCGAVFDDELWKVCPRCEERYMNFMRKGSNTKPYVPTTMIEATMRAREEAEKTMNKIDPFHYRKRCKGEGLAFEIFDVFNSKKVQVRKIYLDGHIEGFEGDPCIVNHIFPKIQAIKYFAQNMDKEYRDLIQKFTLSDFYPVEQVDELYKKFKETIEKI